MALFLMLLATFAVAVGALSLAVTVGGYTGQQRILPPCWPSLSKDGACSARGQALAAPAASRALHCTPLRLPHPAADHGTQTQQPATY